MVTITGAQMNMSGKKKKQPKASKYYLADDGTVISAKDWKWLKEKRLGTSVPGFGLVGVRQKIKRISGFLYI